MKVLGMISGTSHDGIDVAVVDFGLGADGMLDGRVVHAGSTAYEPALRRRLLSTLPPAEAHYADLCELDTLIGQAFAASAAEAATASGGVDLICSHGQTVYHWVEDDHARGTLQIGQPAWIAQRVGVPVVADVRVRDITVGGHGAPLVSHLDTLLLAALPGNPAALNLGGIANLTVVRPAGGGEPVAFDVGPANALIDAAMLRADPSGPGYDVDGRIAASGAVDAELLGELLAEPYYRLPAPKSTGKELFNADYLGGALRRRSGSGDRPELSHADIVATVTALSARVVADSVREHGIDTLVVSGGGWLNPTLRSMLTDAVPGVVVRSTDQLGAPADAKEAIAFALIGWHTWHGLPAVVPSCTGASQASVLGAITPGAQPLRIPAPLDEAPLTLRLHGDPA